jgi:PadR family transcriptional regulator, regulatory protein PadR
MTRRHGRHRAHGRARTRWVTPAGELHVRARVERFGEPALLLLLREQPAHGYELLERLPELIPDERIDMGNLYRVLRALEEDDFVQSEWHGDLPGPAKRTYELTAAGRRLLDRWVGALRESQELVDAFVERYEREKEVNDAPPT